MPKPDWIIITPMSGSGDKEVSIAASSNFGMLRYENIQVKGKGIVKNVYFNQKAFTYNSPFYALNSNITTIPSYKQIQFKGPMEFVVNLNIKGNTYFEQKKKLIFNYIKENKIITDKNIVTLLLDEPDRNLDIDNIKNILPIYEYIKSDTQIISVIHNPILIYILSKYNHINWIETENGYKDKIINYINNLNKYV